MHRLESIQIIGNASEIHESRPGYALEVRCSEGDWKPASVVLAKTRLLTKKRKEKNPEIRT